jgi:radical SAM superfamily enzyme YgiQ (UPF0313 family)
MSNGKVVLFYPTYEGISRWHWMPFPFLYLAPYLERGGFSVRIIDARVEVDWREVLRTELADALCLGVTSMTGPDLLAAMEAAGIAKVLRPDLPVVWGGPHATDLPELTAEHEHVDVVVVGQGEEILLELCRRVAAGRDWADVPGVVYRRDGKVQATPSAPCVRFDHDLFPAYHLLDVERYRSHNNVVSLFSALGCPFKCTFCTTGEKQYLARTDVQATREIDYLVKDLGFHNLFFQDGTFFLKKARVMTLARHLRDLGPEVKWKAKARANSLLDYGPDELSLLRDSGLVSVFFGLESGSPKILKIMNKGIDTGMAEKSAAICRDYGFEFYTSFMFAVPHEGVEDLKLSLSYIDRLRDINPAVIVQQCVYIPLPGTPMYDMVLECGYTPPATLEEWAKRNITSRFEERTDVTWLPAAEREEYIRLFNETFGYVQHLFEKERDGKYTSAFLKSSGQQGLGADGMPRG